MNTFQREQSHQNTALLELVRNPQSRLKISEDVGKINCQNLNR